MLLQKKNYGLKAAMALGSVIATTNVVSADQVTVINDGNNGQLSPDVSTQASADQLDTRSTQENGKTVVNVTNMLMFDKSTTLPTTNTSYKEQVRTVTNFKYVDEFGKELKAPTTDRQATIAGYEIAKESTQTTTSHSRNDETRVDLTTHTTTTTITYRKVATTPTVNPSNPTPVTQPVTNTTNMFKYVDESGNTLKASTNTRQADIKGYEIAKESTKTEASTSGNVTNKTVTTTITYRKMATPTIQPGSTPVKPTETQPVTNTKTVFRYVDGSGKELKSSTSTRQDAISGYTIAKEETKTETSVSGNVTNKTVTTTITYKASTGKGTTRWTDDKGVDLKAKVSGTFKDTDGNDIPGYQLMAIETDEDDNVVNIYKKINTSTPTTGTKPTTNTPTTGTPATGTPTTGNRPTTSAPTTGTPTTGTKPTTGTTPTTSTPTTGTKPTTGNTSAAPRVNTITVYEYVDEAGKALKPKTATRLDKIPGYSIVKEENKTETKTSGNVTNKTITTRITYKKSTSTTTVTPSDTIVTHVYKYVDEQGEPVALATSFRHDEVSGYQKLREETSTETRTVNGEKHELTVTTITYRAETPTDVKPGTTPDKNTDTTQVSTTTGTTPGSTSGKQNTTGITAGATVSTTQSLKGNDEGSKGGVQTASQPGTTQPTQQGATRGTQQGTSQDAQQGTKPQLPQTGDAGSFLTMVGSLMSGLGFVGFKKRKK